MNLQKFLILDVSHEVNNKTQESFYVMKAFGYVSRFGKVTKEAITIRLDDKQYKTYLTKIGSEVELNIILPHSDYSYVLAS